MKIRLDWIILFPAGIFINLILPVRGIKEENQGILQEKVVRSPIMVMTVRQNDCKWLWING